MRKVRTYTKTCKLCSVSFLSQTWNKKYCTKECKLTAFATGFADYDCGFTNCLQCKVEFHKKTYRHKYCSQGCKVQYEQIHGLVPTDVQYAKISGDWHRYLLRLCTKATRSALTPGILKDILDAQGGKCALTGVSLTCLLQRGTRTSTNASVDRIVPGGPYEKDNIRLVCARINILRGNMTDSEFLYWCKLVTVNLEPKHAA